MTRLENANPTCPWSSEIPTFYSSQARHSGHRKTLDVMTSTLPLRTLNSVTGLLAVILYQINYDRKHVRWNIVWTELYTAYADAAEMLLAVN